MKSITFPDQARTSPSFLRRHAASFLAVLLILVSGGCQLPDVGPFVEGTAQLKGAVATAGAATEQELRFAFEDTTAADSLHDNWKARNKAMTALLRYAQSLDAIAAAGRSGAESAGEVAASVQGLAEAAGIVIPGSAEALAVATDAAKFIYGQLATIRAAHQLAEALDDAQPAIEQIAEVLRKDLADLDVVAQASDAATAVHLADEYNKVNSDRKSILFAMKTLDPAKPADRAEYETLSGLLASIGPRYDAYQKELQTVEDRLNAVRAVIDATGRALDEWAAAHANLASAVRNKRLVSAQSLMASATELRELVKRMRDL
jgi:hypothetical protein